jgi:hypothetical protein
MADKWMAGAVKRPGALTEKADKAGETPMEFARGHKGAPGLTGQQARFAISARHAAAPHGQEANAQKGRRGAADGEIATSGWKRRRYYGED